MIKNLRVAIDIDDVLAGNAVEFVAYSNKKWGTNLTVDDYNEHWARVWGVDNNEVERRAAMMHREGLVRSYRPTSNAYEVLKQISRNHTLYIATSRRLQMRDDTLEWISLHFPKIFDDAVIYFAGIWDTVGENAHMQTKADLVMSISADVLIDDQPKHCNAVAATGRRAILFGDYAWNRSESILPNVVRCADWREVEQELDRIATA